MRIRLDCIAPLACNRPDDVRRYVAMLRAGKKAPAIWLIKQQRGSKYRYRIFDGAHRLRAARLVGRTTIEARISRRHVVGLPKPDARKSRLPRSAVTRASTKWPATPRRRIRRGSPAMRWRRW